MDLSGVFVPATTPFDAVTGELDVVALRRNARRWLESPLSGLVLFGSTGEGWLLDEEERVRGMEAVRDAVGPGPQLLAGISAESTRTAMRLARQAGEAGADAVLVAPPAYYRPQLTPEALREHYTAVADAAPVPVVLYQVPTAYTGADLSAGLIGELARHANIVGIKDSTGDLKQLAQIVDSCGARFTVLVGSGTIFYAGLEAGARGGILAVAGLAPDAAAELFRHKQAGEETAAGRLQEQLAPLHRAVVGKFGVPGVKAALELLGYAGGPPRPPLRPLRARELRSVREALQQARLLPAAEGA